MCYSKSKIKKEKEPEQRVTSHFFEIHEAAFSPGEAKKLLVLSPANKIDLRLAGWLKDWAPNSYRATGRKMKGKNGVI